MQSEFDTVSVHLSGGVLICLYGFNWFDDQPFDEWEILFSGVFELLSYFQLCMSVFSSL